MIEKYEMCLSFVQVIKRLSSVVNIKKDGKSGIPGNPIPNTFHL